ncbi:MAG: class I SAM-dependent methyltransferase [Actinobacteria bacterium]|nr:class I SAM-dependent methyltransferase [Actinomycetota bacterium]
MNERLAREREFHDERFGGGDERPADAFYAVSTEAEAHYRRAVREIVATGIKALEYGCGAGSEAFVLSELGANVTAIDISPVALERAKLTASTRGIAVSTLVMDAERLAFADHSFDLVAGSGILHHLELGSAIDEVVRVLRPTGRAVFIEPLGHNPVINLYRRLTPGQRTHDEHPLMDEDLDLLRRRFDRVEMSYFVLSALAAFPLRNRAAFESTLARLQGLDRHLFYRVARLRKYAWMLVLELSGPRF